MPSVAGLAIIGATTLAALFGLVALNIPKLFTLSYQTGSFGTSQTSFTASYGVWSTTQETEVSSSSASSFGGGSFSGGISAPPPPTSNGLSPIRASSSDNSYQWSRVVCNFGEGDDWVEQTADCYNAINQKCNLRQAFSIIGVLSNLLGVWCLVEIVIRDSGSTLPSVVWLAAAAFCYFMIFVVVAAEFNSSDNFNDGASCSIVHLLVANYEASLGPTVSVDSELGASFGLYIVAWLLTTAAAIAIRLMVIVTDSTNYFMKTV